MLDGVQGISYCAGRFLFAACGVLGCHSFAHFISSSSCESIFFDPDHPALNQPDGKTVVRSVSAWITTSTIPIRLQESWTAKRSYPRKIHGSGNQADHQKYEWIHN
jgi:hypothetical protein